MDESTAVEYRVEARNSHGTASSSATLTVKGKLTRYRSAHEIQVSSLFSGWMRAPPASTKSRPAILTEQRPHLLLSLSKLSSRDSGQLMRFRLADSSRGG